MRAAISSLSAAPMPLISDSIGRVLGKRYRLLSALGTGASAHVFLAEDVSLQRHVAVKVLQPGLATDEAFLKRFRAEARSVASLNHPHVLRVFDWGEDTDGPYLVLEYLGGGSLRDLLDRDVRLIHSQAAAARGPRWRRGWPTRTSAGWCTVTSSRRTCSSTRRAGCGWPTSAWPAPWPRRPGPSRPARWSGRPATSRPRRPRASPVDGRADVYSLALVLYEAVTGTVPFVTDTTMGTLAARIGQPLPHNDGARARSTTCWPGPPRPTCGPARRGRAGRPAGCAGRRVADAGAPAARHPAPRGLVDHRGFRAPGVSELTDSGGGRRRRCRDGHVLDRDRASWHGDGAAPIGTRAGPGEIFDAEPYRAPAADAAPAPTAGRGAVRSRPAQVVDRGGGRRWWCSLAAGLVAAFETKVFTPSHPTPTLVNLPLAQARAAVAKVHMNLKEGAPVKSITVGAGDVVSQSPKPGVSQKEGSTVTVVVSAGKPDVTVPSLAGMTCAQAATALQSAHFQAVCTPGAYNDTVPAGRPHPVVDRVDPEPDQGALRHHHHDRPVARPPAGDGAEHPDHATPSPRPRPRCRRSG